MAAATKQKAATPASQEAGASISLKRMERATARIEVKGTAPLIVHAWSEKSKQQMLDSQQGRKKPKQLKNPEADFEASMYRFDDDGHGFPTLAFKSATVTGAGRTFGKSVKMTELRLAMQFQPDGTGTQGDMLTRLNGEPRMREDLVRVGMGTADLRYRAEYPDWSAVLTVQYLPGLLDLDSIVALVDAGGLNGVGEWRPERDGVYGTYEVVGA